MKNQAEIKIKTEDGKTLTIFAKDGSNGKDGKDGRDGKDGEKGEQGIPGLNGKDGKDGINGKDGRDGLDGRDGKDGLNGKDGRDGKDLSKKTIKEIEKLLNKPESNLLWVNNGAVKSIVAGSNITIDNTDPQNPIISAAASGGGGSWGSITGTLSDQTDLQSALDLKADVSDLSSYVPYTGATTNVNLGSNNLTINGTTLHTLSSVFTVQRTSDATDLFQVALASGNVTQLYGRFYAPVIYSGGGTTSAPGYTFNGDTNTGLYGNASGAWGLTNDGTTSIYANSSANVHIGGTSPLSGYKLTVTGNQYVDGNLDAERIGYNSTRAVFGERRVYTNELTDALWRADKRFTVTQSGAGILASMFDGDYETNMTIPVSTTNVININVTNQSGVPATGITYPEGKLYVHFYYTNHNYSAISARVQENGVWYALATPVDISTDNVNKVLEFSVPGSNYLTDIELTITTNGSDQVLVTALNYIMDRWTDQTEVPYFDKFATTNNILGLIQFRNTTQGITGSINANGDWYMGTGGSGGKFGIGTSSPGTYHLNVVGNILGNDIVCNSGSVFYSLGTTYLRSTSTNPIHIGDAQAQPIDLGKGGGAVAINTDYSNIISGEKLLIRANSATTSANILRLSGSATGFSGANDTGAYSLVFDGCAYQSSIVQVVGGKIEFTKANTWNYADTPTGTRSIINFYASAGTPNSPTLVKFLSGYWDNTVRLPSLDTDATAPTTSGTTKMVITDANGQLSFTNIPTSGSSTFIGLTDVPANFTGSANKYVRVNAGETALEFVTLAGGGDALKADPLSQFASTTSLQLKGVISDETGSGALVFADTPTLIAPILGTPTSGTLTNCTGLPTTGISGVTASSAEINILDGATLTTTELNYVDGVTSAIQTQLDAKLALAGGTMTGNITLGENASIDLDPAGSADGKYTGIAITGTAGAALAFGDLIYLDPTDSRWELADANAASGADGDARGILGICVLAAAGDGSATKILLNGVVRADTAFPAFTVNNPIYVSETAGDVTQTQPTTTDVVIRILGSALTADEMYFNPDWAWATHT